jgi:hypothetical protein
MRYPPGTNCRPRSVDSKFRLFAIDVDGASGSSAKKVVQLLSQRHSEASLVTVTVCKSLPLNATSDDLQSQNARMIQSRRATPPPEEMAPNVLRTVSCSS